MTKTKTPSRRSGSKANHKNNVPATAKEHIDANPSNESDALEKTETHTPPQIKPLPKKNDLGRMLKSARLEKGLSLREVSTKLCIRQTYLSAIEEGRYKDLPWAAYTSGFVRSYASLVGLDSIDVMAKYQEEIAVHEKRPELIMPESKQKFFLPKTVVVLLACVAALGVYLIWYSLFSSSNTAQISSVSPVLMTAELEPPVSTTDVNDEEDEDLDEDSSTPSEPPTATITLAQTSTPPAKIQIPLQTQPKPQVASTPVQPQATEATDVLDDDATEDEHATESSRDRSTQSYGVDPSDSRVMIEASEDSWVEVTSEEGIHFSRVMQVGDRFYVKGDGKGFFLSTGNAKVLVIYVDGKKVSSPSGTIRRNVSLAADDLLKK